MKRILLSGIQPTGVIHIGNYLGFLRHFVSLQDDVKYGRKIMTIADLHSISTGFKEACRLRKEIRQTLALLLATGVDPTKTIIIQQSRLPEHTELMWILGASTTVPQLMSISQYKEKSLAYKQGSVPIGLLTYPLLQAADILAYKANDVLVGSDQLQHMSVVREAVESFNKKVGTDYFPLPEWITSTSPKIKSLKNPTKKMSKSDKQEKGRINLTDSADVVLCKVKGALSDFTSKITYEPESRPAISNLVNLYSAFTGLNTDQIVEESMEMNTHDFKLKLASIINNQLEPIREKYEMLICDEKKLLDVLEKAEELAKPIIRETLKDVKSIIGFE